MQRKDKLAKLLEKSSFISGDNGLLLCLGKIIPREIPITAKTKTIDATIISKILFCHKLEDGWKTYLQQLIK